MFTYNVVFVAGEQRIKVAELEISHTDLQQMIDQGVEFHLKPVTIVEPHEIEITKAEIVDDKVRFEQDQKEFLNQINVALVEYCNNYHCGFVFDIHTNMYLTDVQRRQFTKAIWYKRNMNASGVKKGYITPGETLTQTHDFDRQVDGG